MYILTLPWAIAPTMSTTGPSSGMRVLGSMTSALKDMTYFLAPAGKWSLTGFFMTCQNMEDISLHQKNPRIYSTSSLMLTLHNNDHYTTSGLKNCFNASQN